MLAPFYRDGRHIPALLRPRENLQVGPAVRGGEPVIVGTRIPSAEVAALLADGVTPERIADFYPGVGADAALAGLPIALKALETADAQRPVRLSGIDPSPFARVKVTDPRTEPPRFWPAEVSQVPRERVAETAGSEAAASG